MTHRGPGRHTLPTLTPHGPHDGPRRVLRVSGSAPYNLHGGARRLLRFSGPGTYARLRWAPPVGPRPKPWLLSHRCRAQPPAPRALPRPPCPFIMGPTLCSAVPALARYCVFDCGPRPLLRVPGPGPDDCDGGPHPLAPRSLPCPPAVVWCTPPLAPRFWPWLRIAVTAGPAPLGVSDDRRP